MHENATWPLEHVKNLPSFSHDNYARFLFLFTNEDIETKKEGQGKWISLFVFELVLLFTRVMTKNTQIKIWILKCTKQAKNDTLLS
jgi:hypothetical protein